MVSPHPPPLSSNGDQALPEPGGRTTRTKPETTARAYIHYDPRRTDYALTEAEMERLAEGGASLWKDLCLVAVSLGVPALVNAAAGALARPPAAGAALFLNALVGATGLLLGAAFAAAWRAEAAGRRALVAAIRDKPRVAVALQDDGPPGTE